MIVNSKLDVHCQLVDQSDKTKSVSDKLKENTQSEKELVVQH